MSVGRSISAKDVSAAGQSRAVLLAGLFAASLGAFWRPLSFLAQSAWQRDEYTHILLVLPVSLALIFLEGRTLSLEPRYSPMGGLTLLGLAAALRAGSAALGQDAGLALNTVALVVCWLGAVWLSYGAQVFRSLQFPLLFLFMLVPLPVSVLDRAVFFLQLGSTEATFLLFRLNGVAVMKQGFVLSMPSLSIEVAKECSGIRSSMMLLVTGLVLSHLFLRSWVNQVIFVLFIVPMAVIKNAVRIFTLSMLAMRVDPGFLEGSLHRDGGIVFFTLGLLAMVGLLWLLRRIERNRRNLGDSGGPGTDLPLGAKASAL